MKENILSFDEVLNQIDCKCSSILLGNGFSIGYDKDRFSFTNLFESAKKSGIIENDSNIEKAFETINTKDFEKVIRYLDEAKVLSEIYFNGYNTKQLEEDIKNLKKYLVDVIMNNHPENVSEFIGHVNSANCASVLAKFNRIFTLNYDLLLYWVVMENKNKLSNKADGFGDADEEKDYVSFLNSDVNFYFLHGALHIFDKKTETIKITYNRTGNSLKNQIMKNLDENIYPVFISEGTWKDKMEKIRHNYYLNRCYNSFSKIGGDLVIYGTTLKSNDEHILNAILNNNKLKRIYVGCNSNKQSADELKEKILSFNTKKIKKDVFIYDLKAAKFWTGKND